MVGFYRNLSRLSPAAALHQAQVDALARIRARDGFAAPRLWAPFVLESANGFTPAAARQ
jgi:CHAT domain-containing protein